MAYDARHRQPMPCAHVLIIILTFRNVYCPGPEPSCPGPCPGRPGCGYTTDIASYPGSFPLEPGYEARTPRCHRTSYLNYELVCVCPRPLFICHNHLYKSCLCMLYMNLLKMWYPQVVVHMFGCNYMDKFGVCCWFSKSTSKMGFTVS